MERLKIYSSIKCFLFLFMSILLILIIFPTYSIFGYKHQVLSSTNPDLYVTITEMPLFHVISDDFYSVSLKVGYIFLLIIEIISFILCIILMIFFITKRNKITYILFPITSVFVLLLELFIICLFYKNPAILTISMIFLIITLIIIVLDPIINKKGEKL